MRNSRPIWLVALSLGAVGTAHAVPSAGALHGGLPTHVDGMGGFRITSWAAAPIGAADKSGRGPGRIDLSEAALAEATENITVYAKRHNLRPTALIHAGTDLGPVQLAGGAVTDGTFYGAKAKLKIPFPGFGRAALSLAVAGGHDRINASTIVSSALASLAWHVKF